MADGMTSVAPEAGPKLIPLEARKKQFQDSQDLTETARKAAEQDRDYRDGKQWTANEIHKLRKRGQPPIVKNRIARKVDALIGIEERSASDPKAYPRTPNDEDAADVATDSLRFVCDGNRYPAIKSKMLDNLIVEGTCGAEIIVEQRGQQIDVIINRLRWETIFADPHSRESDFSDAKYKGAATWMDIDGVAALFGEDARKIAEDSLGNSSLVSGSFEDRPNAMQAMTDRRNKRVVVVDMYQKAADGWHRYVFCAGGDLIPGGPSPYLDEYGAPTCPLELQSLYIDRENQRYGLVRGMLGAQDEINYRSSKALHLISTRQTFGSMMAGVDVDKVKREMSRPDGHIEMQAGEFGKDFGIIPTTDMAQGNLQLLQEAKNEIELLGPNNALRGQGSDSQSGKAWLAQQQAGLAELAPLYAALNDLNLRIYRQIWARCRQFWTAERYVRVTDNENAFRFIHVNQPAVDMNGNPVIDPMTGQPKMLNRPSEMNVDIIVDSSPDVTTAMEEQLQMLVKLREMGDPIPSLAIIQASNLRNKRQVIDSIKEAQAQAQQAPPPDPIEVEKLRQGQEKLRQTGVATEAGARKTIAETRKTELEIAASLAAPVTMAQPIYY